MTALRRWRVVTPAIAILVWALAAPAALAVEERPVHPPTPAPKPDLSDMEATQSEIEQALREHMSLQALVGSVLVGLESLEIAEPLPPDPTPIKAVEITIDPLGGITVRDRDDKVYHQFAGVAVPVLPRGLRATRLEDYREVTRGDIVHIGSDVVVEEGNLVDGSVTCVFCDVTIHGEVTGVVVSVFGDIKVDGRIGEDAIAPFGTVHVTTSGDICCDVVGSQIKKDPGGRIGGMRSQILFEFFGEEWESVSRLWTRTTLTVLIILKVIFWLFLALLAYALACKNIVRVKRKIAASPIKAFFVGLLVQILFLPVLLILMVTIIGIPVAVFIVPLLVVAGLVLAYAAAGLLLGEKIGHNTAIPLRSPLSQTMIGLLILQSLSLAWLAVFWLSRSWGGGGTLRLLAFALGGLSILVGYVVLTVGSGAVVMTRFGTRPKDEVVCDPDAPPEPAPNAGGATPLPGASPGQLPKTDDTGAAPAIG